MPAHLRRYDEPGDAHFWTISCRRRLTFFHDDAMKRIVTDGLRVIQRRFGVCLIGYVIMPEHVQEPDHARLGRSTRTVALGQLPVLRVR